MPFATGPRRLLTPLMYVSGGLGLGLAGAAVVCVAVGMSGPGRRLLEVSGVLVGVGVGACVWRDAYRRVRW